METQGNPHFQSHGDLRPVKNPLTNTDRSKEIANKQDIILMPYFPKEKVEFLIASTLYSQRKDEKQSLSLAQPQLLWIPGE